MARKSPAASPSPPRRDWIVSPWFDLLFFANLLWLVALLPGYVSAEGAVHVQFWQVHFITMPHRWLTLFLVALDADRRGGRTWRFVSIAFIVAAVILAVRFGDGSFVCLAFINYVWNSWHFASQHSGILRIYACRSDGGRRWLETWPFRAFVFYVLLRPIPELTGWLDTLVPTSKNFAAQLWPVDLAMLCIPATMLALELANRPSLRPGKIAYLASVSGIYGAFLYAASWGVATWVVALSIAAALFHAIEYLAIVTHYAWRRKHTGSAGLFQRMAGSWGGVLAGFILCFGLFNYFASNDAYLAEFWLGATLWASTLHFAFDGMIWKLRRPATAQALDARPQGQEASAGT